jgi:hypothetical protein
MTGRAFGCFVLGCAFIIACAVAIAQLIGDYPWM